MVVHKPLLRINLPRDNLKIVVWKHFTISSGKLWWEMFALKLPQVWKFTEKITVEIVFQWLL